VPKKACFTEALSHAQRQGYKTIFPKEKLKLSVPRVDQGHAGLDSKNRFFAVTWCSQESDTCWYIYDMNGRPQNSKWKQPVTAG
jgi:hypothetical protein